MNREDCKVGMVVEFGRIGGQKTKGIIRKLNPTRARVETLEARGWKSPKGALWVSYSAMTPFEDTSELKGVTPLVYSPVDNNNAIITAIVDIYFRLSPENLSHDGELPPDIVRRNYGRLLNQLHHLEMALGRKVSESEAMAWDSDRRKKMMLVDQSTK